MARNRRINLNNSNAAVILDELVAVGIVLILISTTLMALSEFQRYSLSESDQQELYEKVVEISKELQTNDVLIYRGQTGVFDIAKINEFNKNTLLRIIIVPKGIGLELILEDVSIGEIKLNLTLVTGNLALNDIKTVDSASYESPVNIRLNDFETHAGLLNIFLWR